jgi:hypothetical protein
VRDYRIALGSNQSSLRLSFQRGLVAQTGVNGITEETLLTVLIDRLTTRLQKEPARLDVLKDAIRSLEGVVEKLTNFTLGPGVTTARMTGSPTNWPFLVDIDPGMPIGSVKIHDGEAFVLQDDGRLHYSQLETEKHRNKPRV